MRHVPCPRVARTACSMPRLYLEVSDQYERDMTDATVTVQRPWLNMCVPGLVGADGQLWSNSMIDTYRAHYHTYYTTAQISSCSGCALLTLFSWVGRLQQRRWEQQVRLCKVNKEIRLRGAKKMEEAERKEVEAEVAEEEAVVGVTAQEGTLGE